MLEENAKNVLLVGEKLNYLIISIVSNLQSETLNANVCSADIESLNRADKDIQALIIYADSTLAADHQLLVYLKDLVLEKDIAVFVIGADDELESIRTVIPKHMIQEEFLRPINVKKVAESIANYVLSDKAQNKKKILVVDDSSVMLHSLKGWLGDKYQVTLADSGISAIKCLSLNRPDLILLDYEMPICDGKQVLQMIRSEMEFVDIPVIFLTGRGDKKSVMEVMSLKPSGYLLKSMRPMEIIQAIDDFFAKQKGRY